MVLNVHVHGGYPSYELSGTSWNGDDYRAYQFVQALKGNDFNGYADFKRANGQWVRIDSANKELAHIIFGEWASTKLAQLGLHNATIVPVPSSSCLAIGQDPKGRRLAEAIVSRLSGTKVSERLHWAEKFEKSSEGGPRDPHILFPNLRIIPTAPDTPVVLIDDVVTSGGHLLACAKGLRHFGATVEHAICAALTVHDRPPNGIFNIASWDAELGPASG